MNKKLIGCFTALSALCMASGIFVGCAGDDPIIPPPSGGDNPLPEEPSQVEVEIEESKGELSEITVGSVRVQLLSDTLVRIENEGPKGFEDRASYVVNNRYDWNKTEYTLSQENGNVSIQTAQYTVVIPYEGQAEDTYVTDETGEVLWRYSDAGETGTNVYLPSPSDALKSWYFTDSPRVIPSPYGYSDVAGPALQGWDFGNNATDAFVFLPQGDYHQFCLDYTALTGESEMVTLQMLGFWDSRWYAYSSETALQQIRDYTEKGYSIDVLVIDTDWRDASSGVGYEINTQLFPDMAEFLEDCHDLGVNVVFNDHPEPATKGNGLDKDEVAFRNEKLTLLLSLGLDYWWYDRNWHVALNSFSPDVSVFAFGMYAYQWITNDYLESIADLNEYAERALIMGNVDGCLHGKWNYASDLSAHRYSIQWTGDIGADTAALSQEIYASVFGGAEVGLPYMSSDIGGHTQPVTDTMYTRWIQYGALSTICRVHCTHADYIGQVGRMPWLYGETAEEVTHTYLDMRYRLLPLYYYLAHENYETGLPVMRRLDIEYPDYIESQRNDEYLLGDYVLVAPLTEGTPNFPVAESRLTHEDGTASAPGLKAQYYASSDWTGTPTEKIDRNIGFDWGTGGPSGFGADNFSIRWTGNITIGDRPAALSFFADDAVLVYLDGELVIDGSDVYDNYLSTDVLQANRTYELEVKYAEFGGNAHVYMYYVEQTSQSNYKNERTVFIPDGTWIDVWSGDRFVGPNTYTVSHGIKTSPIFVREGSLIALAPNMVNTSEKDWSELALEIYPSANYGANITLYEDDVTTVAYKDGKFRTTDISMTFDASKKTLTVTIDGAKGTFEGARAFEDRMWNLRLHLNSEWGEPTKVKLNGKLTSGSIVAQSDDAKPFAFTGAALDSDLYLLSFEGKVADSYVVEFSFAEVTETERNEAYDDTAVPFELKFEEAGSSVDLAANGSIDWISFGEDNESLYLQKEGGSVFSFPTSYDTAWRSNDNFLMKYLDGGVTAMGGISSQKDFAMEIATADTPAFYVFYVGGNKCTVKFTVRDRAGNVQTVTFGNIEDSFMQRVVIECTQPVESSLYITYSVRASEPNGTGTYTSLSMLCAYAGVEVPEVSDGEDVNVTASVESSVFPPSKVNLSEAGAAFDEATMDWWHFSELDSARVVQRMKGTAIENVIFREQRAFYDYAAQISYYDGLENGAHTGSTNGTCSAGSITVNVTVTPDVKHIVLYTGAWRATNTVDVYTQAGTLLARNDSFTAGESSAPRAVTVAVDAKEEAKLVIIIRSTNEGSGGNVSLAGIAVTGTYSEDAAVTLSYEGKTAATGDVDISLNAIDWKHLGASAEKTGADNIVSLQTSGWTTGFNDYPATLSYTDTAGSDSGLTSGIAGDYIRFNVAVDENTSALRLYAGVYDATANIAILDSSGRMLYAGALHTATGTFDCFFFDFAIEAEGEETITVVYSKGGSGSGNAGISAIVLQ